MTHPTDKSPELLPCPFCGGSMGIEENGRAYGKYDLVCQGLNRLAPHCGMRISGFMDIEGAASRCNTRAGENR